MNIFKSSLSRYYPLIILLVIFLVAPLFLRADILGLFNKIVIFALLAMSLDILFGYSGLWSFCHAVFFATGAYTVGILVTRVGIESFWLAAPIGILMSIVVAAIVGFVALRVSAIYFLIITFAFGQLAYNVAERWVSMTGGRYGIVGVPYPNLFGFDWYSPIIYYYFSFIVVFLCALLLFFITKSHFGVVLQGIRESEPRMRVLGYNTWLYRYFAFIIAGAFAGIAGILYVYYNGVIISGQVGVGMSGFILLMLIVGGTGSLYGAMIGCIVVSFLQYFISLVTPERWPLILGICFVATVTILRGGIYPYLQKLWTRLQRT